VFCRDGVPGPGLVNSDLVRSFVVADDADVEAVRRCARQSEVPGMQSECRRLALVKPSIDRFAACSTWALTGTNERRRHVGFGIRREAIGKKDCAAIKMSKRPTAYISSPQERSRSIRIYTFPSGTPLSTDPSPDGQHEDISDRAKDRITTLLTSKEKE
jgi:hypothetical protein